MRCADPSATDASSWPAPLSLSLSLLSLPLSVSLSLSLSLRLSFFLFFLSATSLPEGKCTKPIRKSGVSAGPVRALCCGKRPPFAVFTGDVERGTEAPLSPDGPRRVCSALPSPLHRWAAREAHKMSTRTPLPTVNERDTENVSAASRCVGRAGGEEEGGTPAW